MPYAFLTAWTAMVLLLPVVARDIAALADVSNIVFTPGRTESELNFAWQTYGGSSADASLQVVLKSEMTGADFPEDKAQTFAGKSADFGNGLTSHKATATGLAPSTSFLYRLGTGQPGVWSDVYEFSTRDREVYSVILVGDPQIGDRRIDDDTDGWRDTMDKALRKAPDAAFVLSVGDLVKSASSQEQYDGLLSISQFRILPFVPTIGNHDDNILFSYHFNIPNENLHSGKTEAGGNYYFVYGNSLFIVINSNSLNYNQHKTFIRGVVKKHRQTRWKIVLMHHSIYGADLARSRTLDLKESLVPVFDKYGIDAVLAGHDHIYARSRFMRDDSVVPPLEEFPARLTPPSEIPDGAVIKPEGVLYLTASSSSGSKYYDPPRQFFDYLAERSAPYVPMFSRVNITNTSFEIVTFKTDDMAVIDSFVMVKAAVKDAQPQSVFTVTLAIGVVFCIVLAFIRRKRRGGKVKASSKNPWVHGRAARVPSKKRDF